MLSFKLKILNYENHIEKDLIDTILLSIIKNTIKILLYYLLL